MIVVEVEEMKMKETNQYIKGLVKRYVYGAASVNEIAELGDWLKADHGNKALFEKLKSDIEKQAEMDVNDEWERFANKFELNNKASFKSRRLLGFASVAASIAIVMVVTMQIFSAANNKYSSMLSTNEPEGDNTVLNLADGQQFTLNEQHATVEADKDGEQFIVEKNQIVKTKGETAAQSQLNQIQVPYGKTAKLILADGTKVWLNAGSQLVFPNHFNNKDHRDVMLLGEGFFEVTHSESQPFRVLTDKLTYTVLGTSFNIRSYDHSPIHSAVLVDGSLKVDENALFNKESVILKPGEKCSFANNEGQIIIQQVNTSIYTSWKNGFLTLEKNNLRTLIYQIEHYYNCDITISNELLEMHIQLSGKLMLDTDAERVCKALCDLSGMGYRIENNQVSFYKQE
ncbi:FecR family protein [Carboxylicivirga marina]|uniref:FecR family protein n=1 Tax=Carboxylicivirga marina TaxID=2800988 RepID=UPI002595DC7E|nr:FecR family protein [uncultured Carboxylicivirga sp.]